VLHKSQHLWRRLPQRIGSVVDERFISPSDQVAQRRVPPQKPRCNTHPQGLPQFADRTYCQDQARESAPPQPHTPTEQAAQPGSARELPHGRKPHVNRLLPNGGAADNKVIPEFKSAGIHRRLANRGLWPLRSGSDGWTLAWNVWKKWLNMASILDMRGESVNVKESGMDMPASSGSGSTCTTAHP
jgi:hypothetical protein